MDDFTVNVRQIVQYPPKTSLGAFDRVLLQESDAQGIAAGAYKSAKLIELLSTAFLSGGVLQFKLDGISGIAWDGASIIANANGFAFSRPINAPVVNIDGQPAATRAYVDALFEALGLELSNSFSNLVTSFNGRRGDIFLEDVDILRAGGVLQNNAHFQGNVTAPTFWDPTDSTDRIATTAFVQHTICFWLSNSPLVHSFNGRTGVVTLTDDDITAAATAVGAQPKANTPPFGDDSKRIATTAFVGEAVEDLRDWVIDHVAQGIDLSAYALLDSPQFSGIPTAPTANPGTTTGQIATTAFVMNAVSGATAGVSSFNTRTGAVTLTTADVTGAGGAPVASPTFTGTPAAPTAVAGTNTTQIATTAFVATAITNATGNVVSSFNTRTGSVTLTTADITGAGGAPLASPALSGTPTAPTASVGTNTTQLATTAFVQAAVATASGGVTSFNGRQGAVTLQTNDVSAAGAALVASPTFTGTPQAPTAAPGTNTNQLATTAFVMAALGGGTTLVTSFNGRTGAVTLTSADVTGAGGAPISSPAFTGTPTAPTAAQTVNDTTIATTAYVRAAIGAATGVASFNGRIGTVTLLAADVTGVGGALLASPSFTGTPAGPTAAPGTNTTQLATTAFVQNAVGAAVTSFNGRTGPVTFIANDITNAGGALLASPTFTGTPNAPTPTTGTNNTQIATTAFVNAAITAAGGVVLTQADAAPSLTTNTFWFDSINGQLYIRYVDPVSSARTWVIANSTVQPPPPAPAPGSRVKISTQVVSTPVATLVFIYPFDATYDEYVIEWFGARPSVTDANLLVQISTDGGANWLTGAGQYGWAYTLASSGGAGSSGGGGNTAMFLSTGMLTTHPGSGTMRFWPRSGSPSTPARYFMTDSLCQNSSAALRMIGNGYHTAGDISALRIFASSGNIATGTFTLYGVQK